MLYYLLAIPAVQKTATKVMGIIAGVAVLIALIALLVKNVIIPMIEYKKYKGEMQVKQQKEQELNKIWLANYPKINSALKTVFYAGLVDSWKNIQDMLEYKVKDTCPYCNGKLVEGEDKWINTTSLQHSPTGQLVNTNYGYKHLWVGEQKPDGGYDWTKPTVCENCRRMLFKKYNTCRVHINDDMQRYSDYDESYSFEGIKWRNPNTENALGKELCDYIDANGHLNPATLSSKSRRI